MEAPTADDLLGYKIQADAIAAHVLTLGTEDTPLTIGVYGEWGSGKTSFLMMIARALKNSGIAPVWFHAWKYEKEDNLWAAVIQTIVGEGTIHGRWFNRVWGKVRIKLRSVTPFAGVVEMGRAATNILSRLALAGACGVVAAKSTAFGPTLIPLLGPLNRPGIAGGSIS